MVGTSMSVDERRLALLWYTEDGMSPKDVAALLRRGQVHIDTVLGEEAGWERPWSDQAVITSCNLRLGSSVGAAHQRC